MTRILRASSLATLAATFLSFGSPGGAFDDGRGDWSGYNWQTIELRDCSGSATTLQCPQYHQKWDWKRDQWVDIAIAVDRGTGTVQLTQRLTDNDPSDTDYVCVTALVVDEFGGNLVAHHTNWHIGPGNQLEKTFAYRSARLDQAIAIHIGSKQCRDGATQDDALYADVLAAIAN